jgi:hypothetical protein
MQGSSWKAGDSTASKDIERSRVLTTVNIKITVFWDVMKCNLAEMDKCPTETR